MLWEVSFACAICAVRVVGSTTHRSPYSLTVTGTLVLMTV